LLGLPSMQEPLERPRTEDPSGRLPADLRSVLRKRAHCRPRAVSLKSLPQALSAIRYLPGEYRYGHPWSILERAGQVLGKHTGRRLDLHVNADRLLFLRGHATRRPMPSGFLPVLGQARSACRRASMPAGLNWLSARVLVCLPWPFFLQAPLECADRQNACCKSRPGACRAACIPLPGCCLFLVPTAGRVIGVMKRSKNCVASRMFNRTCRQEVLNAFLFENVGQVRQITAQWLRL
jgi:hypothetical protein